MVPCIDDNIPVCPLSPTRRQYAFSYPYSDFPRVLPPTCTCATSSTPPSRALSSRAARLPSRTVTR
eukprot:2111377-Rhodomonas_salina.1